MTYSILLLAAAFASGQHQQQQQHEQHAHAADHKGQGFLMQQASGTSVNPTSAPLEMMSTTTGKWNFMLHGVGSINHIQQTGPRGGDKLFSTNWLMASAEHALGQGNVMFRAMVSLEPLTITQRRYPELFQTGETAFGQPIVDGQHPHDLFMELSIGYARAWGEKTIFNLYAAPVGDPALGPVAFPHRMSASELPQATLSHHVQDSTHIANEVITAGITHGIFRFEASGFHGAEPNENRWNIDHGGIDSWSSRVTVIPNGNWVGQVSVGRLEKPEAFEANDIVRSTASISYNQPLDAGNWATSIIWGRNYKTVEQRPANSYLLESVFQFNQRNYLTGRVELVDKDELFANDHETEERLEEEFGTSTFRIAAYTVGYTRDVELIPGFRTGFGGNFTFYTIPSAIKSLYDDNPIAFLFYLRLRPKGKPHMHP